MYLCPYGSVLLVGIIVKRRNVQRPVKVVGYEGSEKLVSWSHFPFPHFPDCETVTVGHPYPCLHSEYRYSLYSKVMGKTNCPTLLANILSVPATSLFYT